MAEEKVEALALGVTVTYSANILYRRHAFSSVAHKLNYSAIKCLYHSRIMTTRKRGKRIVN